MVDYLDEAETGALLAAPDLATRQGRRDRALLLPMVQTGIRVSELTGLDCGDLEFGIGAHVRVGGKGRRERSTPLREDAVTVLREWLKERGGDDRRPLCVPITVIALWLGHQSVESTMKYLHADPKTKDAMVFRDNQDENACCLSHECSRDRASMPHRNVPQRHARPKATGTDCCVRPAVFRVPVLGRRREVRRPCLTDRSVMTGSPLPVIINLHAAGFGVSPEGPQRSGGGA